jgi:hypothetical protein
MSAEGLRHQRYHSLARLLGGPGKRPAGSHALPTRKAPISGRLPAVPQLRGRHSSHPMGSGRLLHRPRGQPSVSRPDHPRPLLPDLPPKHQFSQGQANDMQPLQGPVTRPVHEGPRATPHMRGMHPPRRQSPRVKAGRALQPPPATGAHRPTRRAVPVLAKSHEPAATRGRSRGRPAGKALSLHRQMAVEDRRGRPTIRSPGQPSRKGPAARRVPFSSRSGPHGGSQDVRTS